MATRNVSLGTAFQVNFVSVVGEFLNSHFFHDILLLWGECDTQWWSDFKAAVVAKHVGES